MSNHLITNEQTLLTQHLQGICQPEPSALCRQNIMSAIRNALLSRRILKDMAAGTQHRPSHSLANG